jgi:hypothetical protein
MSDRDAFEDEMAFLGRTSDADVERLLAGRALDADRNGESAEVAAFVTALRAAAPARPRPDLEGALVPRLAAEARSSTEEAARAQTTTIAVPRTPAWRRRLALVGRVAVAFVLAITATAGLAFAGVTIPEPARDAFDAVGIELPNQDEGQESSSEGAAGTDEGDATRPSATKDGSSSNDGGATGSESAKQGGRDRGKDEKHKGGKHKGQNKEPQGSPGGGNGAQASPPGETGPTETGPTGVPPGQGGVPPGQGGTPPGQAAPPPGQGGTPPGQGGEIPGSGSGGQRLEPHGGGPPGGVPPGQAKPK